MTLTMHCAGKAGRGEGVIVEMRGRRWLGAGLVAAALLVAAGVLGGSSFASTTKGGGTSQAVPLQTSAVVIVGTKTPGATSGASASAAGLCTRATAKRLVVDRVADVFCGAFLGPGSRAMVVSLTTGNCLPFVGWELYALKTGGWVHVSLPPHGGLSGHAPKAIGNDIEETLDVRRSGDTLCNPTGGTETRIWRWNGTRLAASPWRQTKPAKAPVSSVGALKFGYFKTPSGNIQCDYVYRGAADANAYVRCGIRSGLKPPPPSRGPGCQVANRVTIGHTGDARLAGPSWCPGEDEGDAGPFAGGQPGSPPVPVVNYGRAWAGGGIRCTSAFSGLTCRNLSGHGFFLSRAAWRQF